MTNLSRRAFLGSLLASTAACAIVLPKARNRVLVIGDGEPQTFSWSDIADPNDWSTSRAWSMPLEDFRRAVVYVPPRYAMSDFPSFVFPNWKWS